MEMLNLSFIILACQLFSRISFLCQDIEKNSDSTIDYSRLNRDLDKSATLGGTLTSGEGPLVKGKLLGKMD